MVPIEWVTVWASQPVCSFGGEKDPLPYQKLVWVETFGYRQKNIYPDHKHTMRVPTVWI